MNLRPLSLLALLLSVAAPLAAKHLYQYRDQNGVLHVTDRPPASSTQVSELKQTLIRAEEQDIVEMFTNDAGGGGPG